VGQKREARQRGKLQMRFSAR